MTPHHDQLGTVTDNQPVQGGTVSPNPQQKSDCRPGQEAASGPDRNVALSTVDPSPMVIEEDHYLEPSNKPNKPRWKRLARNKGKFSDNSRRDKARSKSGRESVNWGWWFCEEI
ncbi:hypothetical protein ACOSQ2_021875 [Xanthoceras sorbifolium]